MHQSKARGVSKQSSSRVYSGRGQKRSRDPAISKFIKAGTYYRSDVQPRYPSTYTPLGGYSTSFAKWQPRGGAAKSRAGTARSTRRPTSLSQRQGTLTTSWFDKNPNRRGLGQKRRRVPTRASARWRGSSVPYLRK